MLLLCRWTLIAFFQTSVITRPRHGTQQVNEIQQNDQIGYLQANQPADSFASLSASLQVQGEGLEPRGKTDHRVSDGPVRPGVPAVSADPAAELTDLHRSGFINADSPAGPRGSF